MPRKRSPRRSVDTDRGHQDGSAVHARPGNGFAPLAVPGDLRLPGVSQAVVHPAGTVTRPNGSRAQPGRSSITLIATPFVDVRRRWHLGLEGGFRVVEASGYRDLERGIARFKPDALLIDALLLPIDGIGAVRRWSAVTNVVLMVGELDEAEAISVLKAGARGYCQRDSDPSVVRKAVEVVQDGERWIGGGVAARLLEGLRLIERRQKRRPTAAIESLDVLTSREREVAQMVGGGARNKEIASRLHITEATVKAHLTAVFRKLDLRDRLHLALLQAARAAERR